MKLSRLTPVLFVVWLVFFMVANNILPVTDPVESNYALTAKEMVLSGNLVIATDLWDILV